MKTLYFDCSSGISGNMTLGALLEIVGDENYLLGELKKLNVDGYEFFITHGHLYNRYHLPPSDKKVILIHGHTHVPCIENTKEYMYLNPGSISDPREGNPNTYMIYENKEFIIKDLEGHEFKSINLDECY